LEIQFHVDLLAEGISLSPYQVFTQEFYPFCYVCHTDNYNKVYIYNLNMSRQFLSSMLLPNFQKPVSPFFQRHLIKTNNSLYFLNYNVLKLRVTCAIFILQSILYK